HRDRLADGRRRVGRRVVAGVAESGLELIARPEPRRGHRLQADAVEDVVARDHRRVPRVEHHTDEWNGTGLHDLDELAEAELAGGKPRQHGEALVRRVPPGHRALGALDHAVAREAARERARLGHERGTIAPRPPPAQALARPETLVSGRNRARACGVGGSWAGRPAAGEAGAANVEALGSRPAPRRGHVVSGHALALRKVCRAGFAGRGTPWALLAVRPRPETESRVGALALHGERELAAIACAGHGLPLGARAPSRAHHAGGVLERDAGRAAVALERGAEREQLRVAAPE